MIEQKQLHLHRPEQNQYGDCWRTCIACILNVPPNNIPHYYEQLWKEGENISQEVHAATNEFLADAGYGVQYIEIPVQCDEEQLRVYISHYFKDMYVIVGCNSKNGGHSVIMKGYDYMWDPAIDNSGCVGPMEDGYYWIGFLVDLVHKEQK